jgi:hypothetical protein
VVDPLEHVLALLSVEGMVGVPLHAGGRSALAFTGRLDIRCEAVVEAFTRVMGRSPGRHRLLGAPRDIGPAWAS